MSEINLDDDDDDDDDDADDVHRRIWKKCRELWRFYSWCRCPALTPLIPASKRRKPQSDNQPL